jgi:serine/threonine protein kinase
VLWRLRASLNVAQFKGVFEDDADVHVLMEWCKGGELTSHIGRGHYSERTVRLQGSVQGCGRILRFSTLRSFSERNPVPAAT